MNRLSNEPVEREEPVEPEEGEEDDGGADGLAEVGGLVGVRRAQLRHQDPEDVHEEARVRQDAQQACKCSRWIVFYRVTQKVLDLGWVEF